MNKIMSYELWIMNKNSIEASIGSNNLTMNLRHKH